MIHEHVPGPTEVPLNIMIMDSSRTETQDIQQVIDPLADPACRTIIHELDEPMTAQELSDVCDLPLSTTYRKVERLTDASLLTTELDIRRDGRHTTRYRSAFTEISIEVDDDRWFTVTITRPLTPEQQLATMWTEVYKEAR